MKVKPFYQYIQKHRNSSGTSQDPKSQLAELIYLDGDFPKTATDFASISNYIELNSRYSQWVSLFDELWQAYLNND
nr:D-alanyl-D-alanine carboxypeptidase [Aerococcus mictus]